MMQQINYTPEFPVKITPGAQASVDEHALQAALDTVLRQCDGCTDVRYIAVSPAASGEHVIVHVVTGLPLEEALREESALVDRVLEALPPEQSSRFLVYVYADTEPCPYAKFVNA